MDAQPKIGGFGCFKGVLQIQFFLLMQFHKAIFYFNPKMGHVLDLAIVGLDLVARNYYFFFVFKKS